MTTPKNGAGLVHSKHLLWIAAAIGIAATVSVFLHYESKAWNNAEHYALQCQIKGVCDTMNTSIKGLERTLDRTVGNLYEDVKEIKSDVKELKKR